jgi:hypothetical protein
MGFNSRDRHHDYWIRTRAREVRRLEAQGLALHLVVIAARGCNDKSFVTCVLDRIHRERGIALLRYGTINRCTYYADRWAQSRGSAVRYVARADLFAAGVHGCVSFDGPDALEARARRAGLVVWRVRPAPIAVHPNAPTLSALRASAAMPSKPG